jgi:hypothetical protein
MVWAVDEGAPPFPNGMEWNGMEWKDEDEDEDEDGVSGEAVEDENEKEGREGKWEPGTQGVLQGVNLLFLTIGNTGPVA